MRRYHEEQHIIEHRAQLYRQLSSYLGPEQDGRAPKPGRFRKALRCSGCGRARCQVCHPNKFPRRVPTRKEKRPWGDGY
jgi:hypothetical protein